MKSKSIDNFSSCAEVVELVDTPGLEPGGASRGGSSPLFGTMKKPETKVSGFFCFIYPGYHKKLL